MISAEVYACLYLRQNSFTLALSVLSSLQNLLRLLSLSLSDLSYQVHHPFLTGAYVAKCLAEHALWRYISDLADLASRSDNTRYGAY